ncbi:BH3-interacting domain death agonist [Cricetulus griseus]|uniref:BH3-interacting domain death agonist n=1 Tax=Cricetulus griseus TaxID=10029 RepID=G3HQ86_CRIGR|nr:BH3-interacting domain death agonist [Cricetulus griseus]XP_027285127.1 BH3-interacting domain death agonist [Cricetulus griseus]EGW04925.1 BH3-interacting domain death agonist [Cricetulus griseus]
MDSQVSNGSGLDTEHITNLLVFGFLQNSKYHFHRELEVLGQELPVPVYLDADEDELQTDGSRASRSYHGRIQPDSESQEDVIQRIAHHLAQVGDELNHSIQPTLVRQLAAQFMNVSLSEEDRRNCLAKALDEVKTAFPRDMENEKAMLIMTLLLAKSVASHEPSLLRDVFRTTVNFINQNLFTSVRNLLRNGMD